VASPATVSRCGMVYLTYEELGWRPFVRTWLYTFFDDEILSDNLREFIYSNFDATIDIGLEKIRDTLTEPIKTVDLQQVVSICNFLEVYLNPTMGFKGTDDEKKKLFNCAYAWSYIWGMGASLDERSKERFDDIARELFKGAQIPQVGSVYDYFYDMKKEKLFKPWASKVPSFVYDKEIPYFELLVPTNDSYRHSFCLELLLSREKPSFFTGLSGVGKSVIIQNSLTRFQEEKDIVPIFINFSAQTSSMRTQQAIEGKLEKKKRTLFGAAPGKKIAIFVDDINMPSTETYGAQPPIELLRLFIDMKGLYDRDEWTWKDVEDTTIVAASAPPGGGRSPITLRFTRHFNMFCVPNADTTTLKKIFGSIVQGFLKAGFQEAVQKLDSALVDATIEIYNKIAEELRPTPSKFHYLFNLRDVSKVFQGILMSKPISIQSPETMAKLWVNESQRVFFDRLINNEDKSWFTHLICELLNRCFRMNMEHDAIFVKEKIMFGDLLKLEAPI
jgi:dynein heavy chain